MDHPYPWLKYLPADDLEDQTVDFDGMKIESPSGEDLGKVEGFVVDSDSGRPYYAVVDAGGWFKSKHFLLPVGHVHLTADDDMLTADLTRERVERFPDARLDALETVERVFDAADASALWARLVERVWSEFGADWSVVVRGSQLAAEAGEGAPDPSVLDALATGVGDRKSVV